MIDDEMDIYLRHRLKNWVARQKPSQDVRERLLQAAKSTPVQDDWLIIRILHSISGVLFSGTAFHPRGEWKVNPATQSRIFSFHLATDWRWAY